MPPPASAVVASPAAIPAPDASGHGGLPAGVSTLSENWDNPGGISFLPDGRSALVTERYTYRVFRLGRDGSKTPIGQVPQTNASSRESQSGLLGVAVSPTWNGTTDKSVFFMHTTSSETRVARMSFDGTSLSDYTPLLTGIKLGSKRNGGKVAFGPDGYLYATTGDSGTGSLAQDKKSLNGKILRMTRDGAPAPGNPFGNYVYSYGHRDPQGLDWDRNGRLWSVEMGEDKFDELNLIKPGANYGWPVCEGLCGVQGMTNPKQTWQSERGVPAQLAIVRNVLYVSTLRGQRLWRVPIEGNSENVGTMTDFYSGQYGRLRAIAKVPGADELWLGTDTHKVGSDKIYRVAIK